MKNHWEDLRVRGHNAYNPERFLEETIEGKHHLCGAEIPDSQIEVHQYPVPPTEGKTSFKERKEIVDKLGMAPIEAKGASQVHEAQMNLVERFYALIKLGYTLTDFENIRIADHLLAQVYGIKVSEYPLKIQNNLRLSMLFERGYLNETLANLSITANDKGAYQHLPKQIEVKTGDQIRGEALEMLLGDDAEMPGRIWTVGQRMASRGFNL